jgi:hypothetical protein
MRNKCKARPNRAYMNLSASVPVPTWIAKTNPERERELLTLIFNTAFDDVQAPSADDLIWWVRKNTQNGDKAYNAGRTARQRVKRLLDKAIRDEAAKPKKTSRKAKPSRRMSILEQRAERWRIEDEQADAEREADRVERESLSDSESN